MENIFVTGMTSLRSGAMEDDNLGNFLIVEAMFRSLREKFPAARIETTLQMSRTFNDRYRLSQNSYEHFWNYNARSLAINLWELVLAALAGLLLRVGLRPRSLLRSSRRLELIYDADCVVDLSGDLFGDNALNRAHLASGLLLPIKCRLLKTKAYMVASSPGPFAHAVTRLLCLASLRRYSLVCVREPISLNILNGVGLVGAKYRMRPCFSFGFRPTEPMADGELLDKEPRLASPKPIVGLAVCNLNFGVPPANKWPRQDEEFTPFVRIVELLVTELQCDVCVFSHRNKILGDGTVVPGLDHRIAERIRDLCPAPIRPNVFTLSGLYSASTMNRIIGRFEALISGRIHGAVQGIMQAIPTAIIDYGMQPKAHKLHGLAMVANLYDYVVDPTRPDSMVATVNKLWANRERIQADLRERVPAIIAESTAVWDDIEADLNGGAS